MRRILFSVRMIDDKQQTNRILLLQLYQWLVCSFKCARRPLSIEKNVAYPRCFWKKRQTNRTTHRWTAITRSHSSQKNQLTPLFSSSMWLIRKRREEQTDDVQVRVLMDELRISEIRCVFEKEISKLSLSRWASLTWIPMSSTFSESMVSRDLYYRLSVINGTRHATTV